MSVCLHPPLGLEYDLGDKIHGLPPFYTKNGGF